LWIVNHPFESQIINCAVFFFSSPFVQLPCLCFVFSPFAFIDSFTLVVVEKLLSCTV
jgi:hypothetical protein